MESQNGLRSMKHSDTAHMMGINRFLFGDISPTEVATSLWRITTTPAGVREVEMSAIGFHRLMGDSKGGNFLGVAWNAIVSQ